MRVLPVLLLALAVSGLLLSGCDGVCGNQEVQRVISPSKEWVAIAFTRDCGATTGSSSQVSLVRNGASLSNEPGNVLVLEASVPLKLSWTPEGQLVVAGSRHVKRFKEENKVAGVSVMFP
jgi:hypothetical protein